ncbi:MAG TPA: glycerophosphodiester phosphodiesterase [Stellaceae bacterium]|nr:glycerophosphodiester phosphodiesterase [Stellaceae bacterium]
MSERDAPSPAPLPPVIGHRGAAAHAPENTLAALSQARALGCRWVEFDVRLTADDELILLHDARLERTTDGNGKAAALPLATIRRYDAGSWFAPAFAGERVPTLAEALSRLGELGLGANIEVKAERGRARRTGERVAAMVARAWPPALPPPILSSFLLPALSGARAEAPELARGLLFRTIPKNWLVVAMKFDCATIHADQRFLNPAIVAEIRRLGYSLLAYTVNDPVRARSLFDWGVTAVFSDLPDAVLAAAGVRQGAVC